MRKIEKEDSPASSPILLTMRKIVIEDTPPSPTAVKPEVYKKQRISKFDKPLSQARKLNFDDEDIDCYIELAILNELRKPEESIKLYEKAIELIKKKDLKNYVFNRTRSLYDIKEDFPKILNNYATIRLRLGYLNGLERILNEALSIIKNNKNDIKNFKDNEEKKDYFIEEVFFFK